jgi:NAD+ synthetase
MRLALAPIDATVGDLAGNAALILAAVREARSRGAQLVVTPELSLVGYPPQDLVERPGFVARVEAAVESLALELAREFPPRLDSAAHGHDELVVIVGALVRDRDPTRPRNVAAILRGGTVTYVAKRLLPTYDVFEEARYFTPGSFDPGAIVEVGGAKLGVLVCEDQWTDPRVWPFGVSPYREDPVADLAKAGAELLVNLSASPFTPRRHVVRAALLRGSARAHGVATALCNAIGCNDGLVFDGGAMLVDGAGHVAALAARFSDQLVLADFDPATRTFAVAADDDARATDLAPLLDEASLVEPPCEISYRADELDAIEDAIVAGLRGWTRKLGVHKVWIGLSGGIDSALVAYLAARAIGAPGVEAVLMPTRFTAGLSNDLAGALARRLGLSARSIDVEPMQQATLQALASSFAGTSAGLAEENLQSRLRGVLLMALSNKHGGVVLTTGNKSEASVGYCTLYGDTNGAVAPIADVWKTQVFALCARIDARARASGEPDVFGPGLLERPPSAELRADQRDDDSLPPYPVLDPILAGMVEDRLEDEDIVRALAARELDEPGAGARAMAPRDASAATARVDLTLVRRVRRLLDGAEFKRAQLAPTLRVSSRSWTGRRYPIVARSTGQDGPQ